MAWATIEIISVYNKTNSCLSSTIEKVVIRPRSGKNWTQKSYLSDPGGRKVGLRKVVYSAWVGERLFIRPGREKS